MTTELHDKQARLDAIQLEFNPLVRAPAGSGKTGLLIQRLLRVLSVVEKPEEVLAITFTNKAANEISARLLEAMADAKTSNPQSDFERETHALVQAVIRRDVEMGWNLMDNPARLNILTIDKLNAMLASQMPAHTGFVRLPEVEPNPSDIYQQVVVRLVGDLDQENVPAEDKEAVAALLLHSNNRTDELGKTLAYMLSSREQWMQDVASLDAGHNVVGDALLSLMESDLAGVSSVAGARLSEAYEVVRNGLTSTSAPWLIDKPLSFSVEWVQCLKGLIKTLTTDKNTLRARVTKREGFEAKAPHTVEMNQLLSDWRDSGAGEVVAQVAELIRSLPDDGQSAEGDALNKATARVLVRALGHLHILIGDTGRCDFAEVAIRAIQALSAGGEVGECLQKMDYTIRHILVDEMQDTSASQYNLLRLLTSGWEPDDGRTLFMVGDPQQSIYGFRQADVRLFQKMWDDESFGDLPLNCLSLESNFRSSGDVVEFNNRVFKQALPAQNDLMRGAVPASLSAPVKSASGQSPASFYLSDSDEATNERIVGEVKRILADSPTDTIAVLGRSRAPLRTVLRGLDDAGVSVNCQDVDTLATDGPVNDVLSLIQALWHPLNRNAWARFLRSPMMGLSYEDLDNLLCADSKRAVPDMIGELQSGNAEAQARIDLLNAGLAFINNDCAVRVDIVASVKTIFARLSGPDIYSGVDAENIAGLFALLTKHAPQGSIENMDAFMDACDSLYPATKQGQVQLMTIHKSKGLEFDHVFIVGMEQAWRGSDSPMLLCRPIPTGTLLVAKPLDDALIVDNQIYRYVKQLETAVSHHEEVRLLYVALTRAKKSIHMFALSVLDEGGRIVAKDTSFVGVMRSFWSNPILLTASGSIGASAVEQDILPTTWVPAALPPLSTGHSCFTQVKNKVASPSSKSDNNGIDFSPVAVAVGTVYHGILETIGRRGLGVWASLSDDERASLIRARLTEHGLANGVLANSTGIVGNLVGKTVSSKTGRWLLDAHDEDYVEYSIQLRTGTSVQSLRLDRFFKDNGQWWVVDYKSDNLDNYSNGVAGLVAHYREQLLDYKRATEALPFVDDIRVAIYSPHVDELIEVS